MMPNRDVEWFQSQQDMKIETTVVWCRAGRKGASSIEKESPAGGSLGFLEGVSRGSVHSVGFDHDADFATTLIELFAISMTSLRMVLLSSVLPTLIRRALPLGLTVKQSACSNGSRSVSSRCAAIARKINQAILLSPCRACCARADSV